MSLSIVNEFVEEEDDVFNFLFKLIKYTSEYSELILKIDFFVKRLYI